MAPILTYSIRFLKFSKGFCMRTLQKLVKKLISVTAQQITNSLLRMNKGRLKQVKALFTEHGQFGKHFLTLRIKNSNPIRKAL